MVEHKQDMLSRLQSRNISGLSATSVQDLYLETEEEMNEETSPVLLMSKTKKLSQDKNPLLANKGSATNGRILTDDDANIYQMVFHSVQHFKPTEESRVNGSGQKSVKSKYSKKQISNLALLDDLMPNNQNAVLDQFSQSVQEIDYSVLHKINKSPQKDAIVPQPLIKASTKSSTKKDTNKSLQKNSQNKYMLKVMGSGEITLNPKNRGSSFDDIIHANSEGDELNSSVDNDDQPYVAQDSIFQEETKEEEKNYEKEMNQLFKIETKFLFRQSNKNLRMSQNNLSADKELLRTETADFPMKLLTHNMLDPLILHNNLQQSNQALILQQEDADHEDQVQQQIIQQQRKGSGTPRFATNEEIEEQELKMLLTFAFKDEEEIVRFSKEMTFIINQEPIIEKPTEQKIRPIKQELRRDPASQKKTLVFTNIDGLFMFSSHAQIVKNCDQTIKIRKDGLKKTLKLFYRPHLHTFLKTLSKYFELVLYLKDDYQYSKQWADVLNQAMEGTVQQSRKQKQKTAQQTNTLVTEGKLFNILLTKDQCIIDKHMRVVCRNKELFLEGRSLKNILFITNDIRDMTLVHQNAIYVRSYHGNKYENTLAKLKVYLLKHILECGDVRDIVKRDFLSHTKQHKVKMPKKSNKEIFLLSNNQLNIKAQKDQIKPQFIQTVAGADLVDNKQIEITNKNGKSNSDKFNRFKEREDSVTMQIFLGDGLNSGDKIKRKSKNITSSRSNSRNKSKSSKQEQQ